MTHASLFIGFGGFDYAAALLGWINTESYIKCIPYNEQTKHLLGTKNDI